MKYADLIPVTEQILKQLQVSQGEKVPDVVLKVLVVLIKELMILCELKDFDAQNPEFWKTVSSQFNDALHELEENVAK